MLSDKYFCVLFFSSIDLDDAQAIISKLKGIIPDIKNDFAVFPAIPDAPLDTPRLFLDDPSSNLGIILSKARLELRTTNHGIPAPEALDRINGLINTIFREFHKNFGMRCNRVGIIASAHVDMPNVISCFHEKYLKEDIIDGSNEAHIHILRKEIRPDFDINTWIRLKAIDYPAQNMSQMNIEVDVNTSPERLLKFTSFLLGKFLKHANNKILSTFESHTTC